MKMELGSQPTTKLSLTRFYKFNLHSSNLRVYYGNMKLFGGRSDSTAHELKLPRPVH
jgi:hypothetical protein